MNRKESNLKIEPTTVIAVIIFIVLGLLFQSYYQHKLFADTTSYISLAKKYLIGDFENVVTGHWGPLLSWLLVPFLYFGVNPLLGAKLLYIIIGAVTIIGVSNLCYRLEISSKIRISIILSLIPLTLYFSLILVTPDLLLLSILTFYLVVIFDVKYSSSPRKGLVCGAIGGIAFLCKHYALPFFVAHFSLLNILHFFRSDSSREKKNIVVNLLSGMAIFSMISGFWITVLSKEFNEFSIGTSGRYVHELYGPESLGELAGPNGFQSLPNETAFSAWENPSLFRGNPWSPFDSKKNFKHQIKITSANFYKLITNLLFSPLSVAIVFAYLVHCLTSGISMVKKTTIYPLITVLSFPLGYLLISHAEERFFWVMDVLLLLMGGHLLTKWTEKFSMSKLQQNVAIFLLVASFLIMPVLNLLSSVNAGKDTYLLSQKLKKKYEIENANTASHNRFRLPLYLSFYLDCRYHGTAKKNISEDELQKQLANYKIDYYFVWNSTRRNTSFPKFFKSLKEVTGGEIPGLSIYETRSLWQNRSS